MKGYNLIAILSPDADRWLMCKRKKPPFEGLYNLVGGKIEANETSRDAAYRELFEETGIPSSDVSLTHLMDLTYHVCGFYIEVYVGRLSHALPLTEEENALSWMPLDLDYFDNTQFAGEGNLGHVLRHILLYKNTLFA